jgi:glycosyltransferase involved in cell wall biosynthesis
MDGTQNAARPIKTLLHAFPSFEVGGSQMRFVATANHLGDRYRHLIVAMNGKTQCLDRLGHHVAFEMIDVDLPPKSTVRNFFTLHRLLRSLRPDKLITYNWGAIEWALANVIPVCRHIHIEDGFGPDETTLGQLPRRALFRRLVLSRRSQVVLPSRTLAEIAARIWRLPPQRLTYVPNGIDCARFMTLPDPELSSHLRHRPDELLIGTVAALRPEKNLARLIEAFALLAPSLPARLVIVGDGAERERLQQLATLLGVGDRVVFMGAVANPELILGALDVFALSSAPCCRPPIAIWWCQNPPPRWPGSSPDCCATMPRAPNWVEKTAPSCAKIMTSRPCSNAMPTCSIVRNISPSHAGMMRKKPV